MASSGAVRSPRMSFVITLPRLRIRPSAAGCGRAATTRAPSHGLQRQRRRPPRREHARHRPDGARCMPLGGPSWCVRPATCACVRADDPGERKRVRAGAARAGCNHGLHTTRGLPPAPRAAAQRTFIKFVSAGRAHARRATRLPPVVARGPTACRVRSCRAACSARVPRRVGALACAYARRVAMIIVLETLQAWAGLA